MEIQAALCQTKPALGNLDQNLSSHLEWLEKAAQKGADLALFPELSLTGYLLRDLTQEIALPLDANPVKELVARSRDMSIVFGMVEESPDHRFFNSAVFAEGGEILHVHRKAFLPDYGIFEEGRYFASGNQIQPVQSRLGKFGLLICEDAWHLAAGWLQFLQGVDAFLFPAASPARGIDTDEDELSSETSWRTLRSGMAMFFQAWVLHCNRVGFEDGAMFWGGSGVVSPSGRLEAEAPGQEEHMLVQAISSESVRRARLQIPLLRNARPDLIRRQLAQILEDPDALKGAEAAEDA